MNNLFNVSLLLFVLLFTGCKSDDPIEEPPTPTDETPTNETPTDETPTNENNVITVELSATRTSGPAPLAVQFRAIGTTHTNSELDTFRELGYHFTFGDLNSGTWEHSNKSKNSQIGGPISAHIFESPGTYTVQVRAQDSDGNYSDESVVITVTDPNVVYEQTNTVVISTNTNTSGAPSGAQLLTNQTSWPQWESGKRYLLMPGQNFSSFGDLEIKKVQDVQVGKNGSGRDPVVGNVHIETGRPSVSNWSKRVVVSDLNSQAVNIANSAKDIYIIRGSNTSFYVGGTVDYYINDDGTPEEINSLIYPFNIFMYESKNTAPTTIMNSYILSTGISILGTELSNCIEHNIRLPLAVNTFIGHNLLHSVRESIRHNIKLHSRGTSINESELAKDNMNNASRWVVVADNTMGDGSTQINDWSIAFAPQNSQEPEGVHDVIIENNYFNFDFKRETILAGSRLTERGNSSVGEYKVNSNPNFANALPASWIGPYYIDAPQIIPDAPGS